MHDCCRAFVAFVMLCLAFAFLAAGGPSPAGASPAAVRPPQKKSDLTYADRKAWYQILRWPQEYEDDFDAVLGVDKDKGWMKFFELAPKKYLVEVQCNLFAYQAGFIYLFYDESVSPPTARLLTFKSFYRDNKQVKTQEEALVAGLPEFSPRTGELSVWTKGRGLGDCGAWAVYRIEGGRAVLQEFRAKDDCDGKYVDPKQYPRLYPR